MQTELVPVPEGMKRRKMPESEEESSKEERPGPVLLFPSYFHSSHYTLLKSIGLFHVYMNESENIHKVFILSAKKEIFGKVLKFYLKWNAKFDA